MGGGELSGNKAFKSGNGGVVGKWAIIMGGGGCREGSSDNPSYGLLART